MTVGIVGHEIVRVRSRQTAELSTLPQKRPSDGGVQRL